MFVEIEISITGRSTQSTCPKTAKFVGLVRNFVKLTEEFFTSILFKHM